MANNPPQAVAQRRIIDNRATAEVAVLVKSGEWEHEIALTKTRAKELIKLDPEGWKLIVRKVQVPGSFGATTNRVLLCECIDCEESIVVVDKGNVGYVYRPTPGHVLESRPRVVAVTK